MRAEREGHVTTAKKNWGTEFSWDKDKGIIPVAAAEGESGCPSPDYSGNS
jgi:hypothetical protein